jgi:hypothetical protein
MPFFGPCISLTASAHRIDNSLGPTHMPLVALTIVLYLLTDTNEVPIMVVHIPQLGIEFQIGPLLPESPGRGYSCGKRSRKSCQRMEYKTVDDHGSKHTTGQSTANQRGLKEATRDRVIAGENKSEKGENID